MCSNVCTFQSGSKGVRSSMWIRLSYFLILFPLLFGGGFSYVYEEELLYDTFPDGFAWGVATAAYQVSAIE